MPLVFANPWMLLAALSAAAPVVIHLISRQRARKLPISTLRFLIQTDRRTARKHKLVDLIVLALRTALLFFLALALAKPYLQPRRKAGDLAPGKTAWAIVLDDSYSMGLVYQGLTAFDRAVAAATDLLNSVPGGDEVMLILTSDRRRERLNSPTYRVEAVIEALRRLESPSYTDAPADSAIDRGVKFLEGASHQNRALVFIGDFQERALRDAIEALKSRGKKGSKPITFYWLDVGSPPEGNTAIESVRIYQAMPFVGLPMQIRASVANHGDQPAKRTISLWIGRSKVESKQVEIAPEAVSEVEFTYVPLEPGNLAVEVRLEGDPLPADNRRFLTWHVTSRVKVVVVHGGSGGSRRWDDVFFLRSALEPVAENPKKGRTRGLQIDDVSADSTGGINWAEYQVAFIVGVDRLRPELAAKLQDFARRGGSVIVFGGSPAAANGQTASPEDPDVALLGLGSGDVHTRMLDEERGLTIGETDSEHPVFRTLTRTAAENLSAIEFYAYRHVGPAGLGGDCRVVAYYDNGAPFLIERRSGEGRIMVFATRCHPDWTNLPVRPLFLPLLYETIKYCVVAQLGLQPDLAPMATLRCPVPKGAKFTRAMIKDPQGRLRSFPLRDDQSELIVERLETPGTYRIYFQGADSEVESIVAVNVNPDEGRIERLDDDQVGRELASANVRIYSSPRALVSALRRQRQGVALAPILLYLAAICFLAESFLANYLIPREQAPAGAKGTAVAR